MLLDLLPEAEASFGQVAEAAHPLFGRLPVVRRDRPEAPGPVEFATDNRAIYVGMNRPGEVDDDLAGLVVPAYRSAVPELYPGAGALTDDELGGALALDTLLFVLLHELYHPIACPTGPADERQVARAIWRGLGEERSRRDRFAVVASLKNLVWDVVVNLTVGARAREPLSALGAALEQTFTRRGRVVGGAPQRRLPVGVIPVLYALSAARARTDVPISIAGYLYAVLCAPGPSARDGLLALFEGRAADEGCAVPLRTVVRDLLVALPQGKRRAATVDRLFSCRQDEVADARSSLFPWLLGLLEHPVHRYEVVTQVARALAPYAAPDGTPRGSPDGGTRGGGRGDGAASGPAEPGDALADTLEDLAGALPAEDANGLLREVARRGGGVNLVAADLWYRRHAEQLLMGRRGDVGRTMDLGPQLRLRLRSTQDLGAAEVARLDQERVSTFQTVTGLPVLMNLAEGHWLLNDWVVEESRIRGYTLVEDLEIPDWWLLAVDSSSSMASPDYVGKAGSPYDLLMRVCYGLWSGLAAAADRLGREPRLGVLNFSDQTRFSGWLPLRAAWAGPRNQAKARLLVPQCGGTTLDVAGLAEAARGVGPGTAVFTAVTDGEISGDPAELTEAFAAFARGPGRAAVFVEIGVESALGTALRAAAKILPSLSCFQVATAAEVLPTLGRVLLRPRKP